MVLNKKIKELSDDNNKNLNKIDSISKQIQDLSNANTNLETENNDIKQKIEEIGFKCEEEENIKGEKITDTKNKEEKDKKDKIKSVKFKDEKIENNKKIEEIGKKVNESGVGEDDMYKCACYILDNNFQDKINYKEELDKIVKDFKDLINDNDGVYMIKNKEGRLDCCQALKKAEREKKLCNETK